MKKLLVYCLISFIVISCSGILRQVLRQGAHHSKLPFYNNFSKKVVVTGFCGKKWERDQLKRLVWIIERGDKYYVVNERECNTLALSLVPPDSFEDRFKYDDDTLRVIVIDLADLQKDCFNYTTYLYSLEDLERNNWEVIHPQDESTTGIKKEYNRFCK